MQDDIIVLKFGSSVLRDAADLHSAATEIGIHVEEGARIVAVVSAIGATTDSLLHAARCTPEQHVDPRALASLLATGESAAAALLVIALERAGISATVLDPGQAGLLTRGERLDADPVDVDRSRLLSELSRAVVVIPGFVGRETDGSTTLLGRGGSDLTALFIAEQLGASCVLLKDVDGIFTSDPAVEGRAAVRFSSASWETAARVGGSVVQTKSIRFAAARGLTFRVASPGGGIGTVVGPGPDRLCSLEATA